MNKRTAGIVTFSVGSVALWALAFYLLANAGASKDLRTYGLAAGFAALMLTLHTILFAIFADRKALTAQWFQRHGKPIEAEVVKVGRRGHRSAWRIKARHRDPRSGAEASFKSDLLRVNPDRKFQPGDKITVYLHPTDSRRYWVDTGLPSKYL